MADHVRASDRKIPQDKYSAHVTHKAQVEDRPSFGVIITNRNRPEPLLACLDSLAVQELPPAWVVISDLSSSQPHQAALIRLAHRYGASYLRIDHDDVWNKSLTFNTAFRMALRSLPPVTHVIQLDADMILHPRLLGEAAAALRASPASLSSSAFYCAPRMAPPDLEPWGIPGDPAGYERMLAQCGPVKPMAVGVFMVLPCDWLADQHGFDEGFTGWGHEDTELWFRVENSLAHSKDVSGTLLIHQWHERQAGAGDVDANWPGLLNRMANRDHVANPAGWGSSRVAQSVLRAGPCRAPSRAGEPAELAGHPPFLPSSG